IGRFGTVSLNGGTISLGNTSNTANQAKSDAIGVINDGTIQGSGEIDTGYFRNRDKGKVNVNPGQSLTIAASSQFSTAGGAAPSTPLSNFGVSHVIVTVDAP